LDILFNNFNNCVKQNYEKAKIDTKLKEEKKARENNNDGKRETIDIDKCYLTTRDN